MRRTSLIRIRGFSAVHRYWRTDWSEERNREVFGDQVARHGHDYRLEVVVSGDPDPETGFVVSLPVLDGCLDEIVDELHDRDLNQAVPEVSDGSMLPSTEALSAWIWTRLEGTLPDGVRLRRVRVWESAELGAEIVADDET